jgi:hypothetical protein
MIYRGKLVIIHVPNGAEITAHLTRDYFPGQDAHLIYDGRSITIPAYGIKRIEIVKYKYNPWLSTVYTTRENKT